MKPNEQPKSKILIALLRVALSEAIHPSDVALLFTGDTPWEDVYRFSAAQGVMALAWDGLMRLQSEGLISQEQIPSRAIKLQWALGVERAERRYETQKQALTKLAKIYNREGVRMMVLKGYGLSLCYPRPEHRTSSDIDIWLFGKQKQADEILRERYNIAIDEDVHHHTVFSLDGVMVENHYDFLNIHAHRSNRDIEAHLKSWGNDGIATTVDSEVIYLPSVNCHALFLIRHAAQHFAAAEIVLRHVTDWAMFVHKHGSEIDWPLLRSICRSHRMDKFLDAMNVIAANIVAFECETGKESVDSYDVETTERILNDILQPEFSEQKPKDGLIQILIFKWRRWWANRWKHRLVYREGLIATLFVQLRSHLLKPKTFKH